MRNRAKCKLCQSVIESFHPGDYVNCKCGEISVSGGNAMFCAANDWNNFVRVDDQDNEIIVSVVSTESQQQQQSLSENQKHPSKPTRKDLLDMLSEMIKSIEGLPKEAMYSPVNHCDLVSALLLIEALFKADSACIERI